MSLEEVRELARGLRCTCPNRDPLDPQGEPENCPVHGQMASVTELRPEPRAALELTEDEIHEALEHLPHTCAAYQKLEQALAIESGPGGNFNHTVTCPACGIHKLDRDGLCPSCGQDNRPAA